MRYLLSLLCCFSLAAQQTVNNFTVKTNLTAQVINNLDVSIASFGAVGDGVTDNTSAIQAAIDKAAQIGGSVRIPTGVFVTGPLVIKTNVFAIIGSQPGSEKFPAQASCQLRLKPNSTSSTILTWASGSMAELRNLFIDGNKSSQTNSDPLVVIGLESGSRDETILSNFGISNAKGWGLKIRRNEVELKNGSVVFCDGGGVWFAGNDSGGYGASDCTLITFGSGFNGGDGILFDGPASGAQRLFNVDSYFNQGDGIEFAGPIGLITGTQVQCNNNFRNNLNFNGYINGIVFDSSTFYGANYNDNAFGVTNSAASGTYSDVYLSPSSGGYSAGIIFNGSRIGINYGAASVKLPKYAFDDSRTNSYNNGTGVTLVGNVIASNSGATFTTGLAISTNTFVNGSILGNTTDGGLKLNSYANGSDLFAGKVFATDNVFLYTTGMTNPATLYQHQNGGLTFRLGDPSSYKYFSFNSSGSSSLPGSLESLGTGSFLGTLTAQDSLSITNSSLGGFINYLSSSGGYNIAVNYPSSPKYFQISGSDGTVTVDGDLIVRNLGKSLKLKEGTNAKMGTATLAAGSAVVSTTSVAVNSRVFLTSNADGGTPGWLRVSTRTAGTSFTITSSSGTDTSTVAWIIFDPAP